MEVKLDTGIDRSVSRVYASQRPEQTTNSLQVSIHSLSRINPILFPLLPRTLNCMGGQMKHILATEQKKTDFRPEDENNVMIQYTTVRELKTRWLINLRLVRFVPLRFLALLRLKVFSSEILFMSEMLSEI